MSLSYKITMLTLFSLWGEFLERESVEKEKQERKRIEEEEEEKNRGRERKKKNGGGKRGWYVVVAGVSI